MAEHHRLIDYHVQRWSEEKWSMGAWSQLLQGGTPEHRRTLGSMINKRLVLAGEACSVSHPAMVHGAAASGRLAARRIHQATTQQAEAAAMSKKWSELSVPKHTREKYECSDCDDDNDDDRANDGEANLYECTLCNKTYYSATDLDEHNTLYRALHKSQQKFREKVEGDDYDNDDDDDDDNYDSASDDSSSSHAKDEERSLGGDDEDEDQDGGISEGEITERIHKIKIHHRRPGNRTIIVGCGAAGIFAARELHKLEGDNTDIVILEARDRLGGRVHTIDLSYSGESSEESKTPINVDTGATWLQQYSENPLVDLCKSFELTMVPTDFCSAKCMAVDGISFSNKQAERMLDRIVAQLERYANEFIEGQDSNVLDALYDWIHTSLKSESEKKLACLLVAGDILSDSGVPLSQLSCKYGLSEPGSSHDDHYIKEGYSSLLHRLATGLRIRHNCPVRAVDWSNEHLIRLTVDDGSVLIADRCIVTVPVSIIQSRALKFIPELPSKHKEALSKIKQGYCNKVILRFKERWWPRCEGGILRWYDWTRFNGDDNDHANAGADDDDNDVYVEGKDDIFHRRKEKVLFNSKHFPHVLDWVEWVDMTDGLGCPILMCLLSGEEAYDRLMKGRSDEEVALDALRAIEKWASLSRIQEVGLGAT